MRVAVVGLSDVGRSPRLQYHALALAREGADVDVVAHAGTPPLPELAGHPRVRLHLLPAPGALSLPARALAGAPPLLGRLLGSRPELILLQAPPTVPALLASLAAARLGAALLVVDWHNLGHTLLGLRLPPSHPPVRLHELHDRALGGHADAHLCVSAAMRAELERWGLRDVRTFLDQPAGRFRPASRDERAALFARLPALAGLAPERTRLAVSPTSFTRDEDFGPLFEAAGRYQGPELAVVVTGLGPLREAFERRVAEAPARVSIRTAFLAHEDYALLLGSADVGLSFHRSSSGLDLPMKIADLRGAGLPVLARDYAPALREIPGLGLFDGGEGLARLLAETLAAPRPPLPAVRWEEEWRRAVWPVLRGVAR